jgi:hypothetical protein
VDGTSSLSFPAFAVEKAMKLSPDPSLLATYQLAFTHDDGCVADFHTLDIGDAIVWPGCSRKWHPKITRTGLRMARRRENS